MAFPTTSVLSSFTFSDGLLQTVSSGAFQDDPSNGDSTTLSVSSNAVGQTAAGAASTWYNAAIFGPDQEVYLEITAAVQYIGLYLRIQQPSGSSSTGDGYLVEYEAGTGLEIYAFTNGVGGAGLTGGQSLTALAVGDGFGASIIGDTIQAYRRDAGVWSAYGTPAVDSTYAGSGYIGFILADSTTQRVDDFGGGTVYVPSERPVGNHPFSSSWLQRTEQFTGARDASAPMWAEWLFGTPAATEHFGATASTYTFGKATAGAATKAGAATSAFTFGKAVSGSRVALGATASTWTLGATTAGVRTRFGASASTYTFGKVVVGFATKRGATASTYTFTKAVVGFATKRGATASVLTFSAVVVGRKTTFGVAALPIVFGATTDGTVTGGAVTHFGATASTYTFTKAVAGARTTFGSLELPIVFTSAISWRGAPKHRSTRIEVRRSGRRRRKALS